MLLFKVAARIGRTVAELRRDLDYEELLEWSEFFEYELETFDKNDYYLAQIAQCAVMPYMQKGKKTSIKDFLIKFKAGKDKVVKLTGIQMKSIFEGLIGASK